MQLEDTGSQDSELSRFSGEFMSRALESQFERERAEEACRHARMLLIAAAAINLLFLTSDWRFLGTPHFWVAIPARAATVALALICLGLLPRCRSQRELSVLMVGWMSMNALAVGALVTSHSNIALFAVIILPIIYYLVVPTPFRWTLIAGVGSSMILLAGYGEHHASPRTGLGLALAMVLLNATMAMMVSRSNRLERLHWLAARCERATSAKLAASREALERMFNASPVAMIVTDQPCGRIIQVNASASSLFGAPAEDLLGDTTARFYVNPLARQELADILAREGHVPEYELDAQRADGTQMIVLVKAATVNMPDGPVVLSAVIDISDRKAFERSLEWLASTDTLTGLPNRMNFFATARAEMTRAVRTMQPLSLLMIDLDHFKSINDTFGHQAGDQALKAFSDLCLKLLRDDDLIGRLGGEEFAVMLPGSDLPEAMAVAEMMRASLEGLRLPGVGEGIRLTASIGISLVLPHERTLDAAISRADAALYRAKRGGRNRVEHVPVSPARASG